MRGGVVLVWSALIAGPALLAQAGATPPGRPAPAADAAAPVSVAADLECPNPLGVGVTGKRAFCDVMSGNDPAEGVLITLPPRVGPATLAFDLHNRHTYSEEMVKAKRAYARYTATIGVLTMDNTLISRAAVQSEFRTADDLIDRVGGGAGPRGVKAVAPTGTASVRITIPEEEATVSLLGEKLTVERIEGVATYTSPGRPVAVVSNVTIEYTPPPPPRPARRAPARRRGR